MFKVYGIDQLSTKVSGIKLDGVLHPFKNLKREGNTTSDWRNRSAGSV